MSEQTTPSSSVEISPNLNNHSIESPNLVLARDVFRTENGCVVDFVTEQAHGLEHVITTAEPKSESEAYVVEHETDKWSEPIVTTVTVENKKPTEVHLTTTHTHDVMVTTDADEPAKPTVLTTATKTSESREHSIDTATIELDVSTAVNDIETSGVQNPEQEDSPSIPTSTEAVQEVIGSEPKPDTETAHEPIISKSEPAGAEASDTGILVTDEYLKAKSEASVTTSLDNIVDNHKDTSKENEPTEVKSTTTTYRSVNHTGWCPPARKLFTPQNDLFLFK